MMPLQLEWDPKKIKQEQKEREQQMVLQQQQQGGSDQVGGPRESLQTFEQHRYFAWLHTFSSLACTPRCT